eukprot:scaffold94240_cov69-Phaeocystis_antarctica.AAC.8
MAVRVGRNKDGLRLREQYRGHHRGQRCQQKRVRTDRRDNVILEPREFLVLPDHQPSRVERQARPMDVHDSREVVE